MRIPVGFTQINIVYTGLAVPNGAEVTFAVDQGVFTTPSDIAAAVADIWEDEILPAQVDDITFASVIAKNGPNATGPFAEWPVGVAGGSSASGWTPNVSILVQKVTELGGRSGRGRMFVPGYPENIAEVNGVLDSTAQLNLTLAFQNVHAALDSAGLPMFLLHSEDTSSDLAPTAITDVFVQNKVATQRRRIRG